jgi:hypothetical protein
MTHSIATLQLKNSHTWSEPLHDKPRRGTHSSASCVGLESSDKGSTDRQRNMPSPGRPEIRSVDMRQSKGAIR